MLDQFNSEAVLDRETGLVWQRSPVTGPAPWVAALSYCRQQVIGDRKGWRLPSYEEMSTLVALEASVAPSALSASITLSTRNRF